MHALREFLNSKAGRWVGWLGAGLATLVMVVALRNFFGQSEAVAGSTDRTFICAETGKSFPFHLDVGMSIPVMSPFSNKNTGYQAELCYWTPDGQVKNDPTPVLLNQFAGRSGPTFCPDCGRLVVPHNHRPQTGDTPPPLQKDYGSKKNDSRG